MITLRNVLGTITIVLLVVVLFWWVIPIVLGIWAGLYLTLSPLIVLVVLPIVLIVWLIKKSRKRQKKVGA